MKKKLLGILICGIFILGITGCGVKSKNYKKNVSFSLKEDTLTNLEATFILTNNSNTNISYGNPYWIEKYEDEKWEKLEPINDLFFTMPSYGLNKNEFKEIEINWEHGYGKLSPGKYRIVKEIDFEYSKKRETVTIEAEFTIES